MGLATILYFFVLQNPSFANSDLEQLKHSLDFKLTKYERVSGLDEYCLGDVVDLAIEESNDQIILRLGEKIVFPELDKKSVKRESTNKCTFEYSREIRNHFLKSKISYRCPEKTNNYDINQSLSFDGKVLTFNYIKKSEIKDRDNEFLCTYKPIVPVKEK